MTIKTQAYLQGYLSKEAEKGTPLPSEVSGDPMGLLDLQGLSSDIELPPELTTTHPFMPRMIDAVSYKNEEEAQKDRRGLANYRALERAATADPQSPTVETYAQWKLKNTPPYKLKHLLSRERAEAIGVQPRLLSSTSGFQPSQYPDQMWLSANPAHYDQFPAVAGHEAVHVRQGHDDYRKYLEDTVQSWNTPWYGRLATGIRDWKNRHTAGIASKINLLKLRLEEDQREHGLRDLRRAGIPPSRYAGHVTPEYRAYRSQPHEAEAFSEGESWASGQNMPHGFSRPWMPEWYKDILNTRGEEAATLEYRRRRALMARKILRARDFPGYTASGKFHRGAGWNAGQRFQKYIEQSTIPNNMMTYAQDPWAVDEARADRKGILKLLEDPNSPFRDKLLQAGWGNVTHGLPNADEGKQ